jgi:outer membrane protein assembly factor BamB
MNLWQFIDRLHQQGLLDERVVEDLRKRVRKLEKKRKITPDMIAKFLVDRGHLTAFQATKLVNEANLVTGTKDAGRDRRAGEPDDDELLLVDDDDEPAVRKRPSGEPNDLDATTVELPPEEASDDEELVELVEIGEEDMPDAPVIEAAPVPPPPVEEPSRPAARSKRSERPKTPTPPPPPPARQAPASAPQQTTARSHLESAADFESSTPQLPGTSRRSSIWQVFGTGGGGQRPVAQRDGAQNPWDSKLLLVGSASLGALIVAFVFLYLSLTRGSADEMFAAAEQDYRDGSYTQAIKRYDRYLDRFPDDRNASLGRVRRHMARLRQVYADPEQGLEVAHEILPQIEPEEGFGEAREELAAILPEIAELLVAEAQQAPDTEEQRRLLALTEKAMTLVNNPVYIPTSLRKSQLTRIDAIQDDMARVERDIGRESSLLAAIEEIGQAVAKSDIVAAYEVRRKLLSSYPGLQNDQRLQEAVLTITEQLKSMVQVEDTAAIQVLTEDRETVGEKRIILADRVGDSNSGEGNSVVCTLTEGTVFALDAASGELLWARFVGTSADCPPTPRDPGQPDGDWLLVDSRHQELVCVEGRTGQLNWRSLIGEPFCQPVVFGFEALVATRSGKLLVLEADTGKLLRQAKLPQTLDVGPTVNRQSGLAYLLGEHDNLYVLSTDSLECQEVYYVGHAAGTVVIPPMFALGHLLVAENVGAEYARLHVMAADEDGMNLQLAQKAVRLRGRVIVPVVRQQNRVLVVTDNRAVEIFEIGNNESNGPIRVVASLSPTAEEPMISYPLWDSGYLWIGNNRLTKYQVQTSTGKLPRQWVKDEQCSTLRPLQLVNDSVVQVYSRQPEPGAVVSSTPTSGFEPTWKTELAGRIIHMIRDSDTLHVITASGRLYDLPLSDVPSGPVTRAKQRIARDQRDVLALSETFDFGDGRWGFSRANSYDSVIVFDPRLEKDTLRRVSLKLPADATAAPLPFSTGMLVPRGNGEVALIDPKTGGEAVHAFHPEVRPGVTYDWHRPAKMPDVRQFAIADDRLGLFIVQTEDQPETHLAMVSRHRLEQSIDGPLAVLNDELFAIMDTAPTKSVTRFTLADGQKASELPLRGVPLFGPNVLGDAVWIVTDQEIICLDQNSEPRWKHEWQYGAIVGRPVMDEGDWIFATEDGNLLRLDSATGQVLMQRQLGEPLAAGPVAAGDQWWTATRSGALVAVDQTDLTK